jgi:hypothetical protein
MLVGRRCRHVVLLIKVSVISPDHRQVGATDAVSTMSMIEQQRPGHLPAIRWQFCSDPSGSSGALRPVVARGNLGAFHRQQGAQCLASRCVASGESGRSHGRP